MYNTISDIGNEVMRVFRRPYGTSAREAIRPSGGQLRRWPTRGHGTRLTLATAGVAGLLVLAGCHSSPSPTPAPTPTQVPSLGTSGTPVTFEPVPPSASPQQAAVVAYRNMWHAFVEAAKTSNPDDPNLTKYASGNALTLIVRSLTESRDLHKVALGDVALNPQVVEFKPPQNPTEVTVSDCADDSNWLVYKDSGGLFNDVPGGRHKVTATVEHTASAWLVTAFTAEAVGTC